MKKYIQSKRYFVTNNDFIPLHAQPSEGYTKLQAVARAQREVDECVELFGGTAADYVSYFHIVDNNFNHCPELDTAI